MKNTMRKIAALLLTLVMVVGMVGCGGGGEAEVPTEADGRTVIYYAASYVTAQVQDAYKEMIEVYNNGQGVTDGVYVQMRDNSGAISGLDSALRGNYQYDVLQLRDDEFKTLAMQGGNYFVALDDYLTDDVKASMQFDQIPDPLVNRFRMNTTPDQGGKFLAGEGATLLAIPNGSDPQVLYDYDALLTESGDVTAKYHAVRKVIQKHLGKELLPVPADRPKKAFGKVNAVSCADLLESKERLARPVETEVPMSAEYYGVGYGYTLYETTLNRDYTDAPLTFQEIGDRAHVFVDGKLIAVMYVNEPPYSTTVSAKNGSVLSVLVENMGRTNFGPKMMRKKGLVGRVLLDNKIHFGWKAYPLPMDNLDQLEFKTGCEAGSLPFYKFEFDISQPCDTFLKLEVFGKGFAELNGFNLGRYWKIGPQKTLFVPKSVLKEGKNTLIVFDSEGAVPAPSVEFVDKPELE